MDARIPLVTLLCTGWIAYANKSGLPLELTQFQSGDDVTLVCSATNTTINMSITNWYIGDERVLALVVAGHTCSTQPPNATGDTPAYRFDLYTSTDVSVSCGYLQHNMTLTTTKYVDAGTVWRCEDQQYRVSDNLTLDFPETTYEASSQLTDSATTSAKLTTIKITTTPSNDNHDDSKYIAAGAGGCVMILIILVICVCVVRRRRKGKLTQAISDADNGAELTASPTNATINIHIDGRINNPDHRNQVEPVDNKDLLTNKTPENILALGDAVDVGDLYAVPDKTAKHQSAVGGAVNVDDLYAVPDKTPKHQLAVGGAVNDGDMYAVPDKTPKHQPAVGGAVNDGDMYAVPDKTPKHQPAVGGAVNIGDLYAVPDMSVKTKNGTYSTWSEADNEYSEV